VASLYSWKLPPAPAPAAIAPLLTEQYGISAGLAIRVASGALNHKTDALALARQYRLITIDTNDARKAGLLQ
jgi:hypothetical protein